MKCLIMSRVIFCAAQDVTGVRKERREEEGEEYWNGEKQRVRESEWKSKREEKREKENGGVSKHSLQMQPWNNISSPARTIICPSETSCVMSGDQNKHGGVDFHNYVSSRVCHMFRNMPSPWAAFKP